MPSGIRPMDHEEATMNYRILQLDANSPRFRELAFRPLAEGQRLDLAEYREVWHGEIHTGDHAAAVLETLFRMFNVDHPDGYQARSMSVSDVVLLGNGDIACAHYCQMVGWEPIPTSRIDNRHAALAACSGCGFRTDRLIGHPDGRELCQSCDAEIA
jgi:hypothetical protein